MNEKKQIRFFILIALGWSYAFWISAIFFSRFNPDWSGIQILHFLGGIGPLVATIVTVSKMDNWKEYLKRVVNFSNFSPFVIIVFLSPIIIGLMVSLIVMGNIALSKDFLNNGILYVIFLFFFGPLPEELGWRGILFDLLQKQSILQAQVITAFIWFIWHLPLFFIVGTYQYSVGFATTGFLLWTMQLLLQSIIMGYLYIFSNRSIASAIIFHYLVNLVGEAFEKNLTTEIITIGFLVILIFLLGFVHNKKAFEK